MSIQHHMFWYVSMTNIVEIIEWLIVVSQILTAKLISNIVKSDSD